MSIKKVFQPIVTLLQANQGLTVAEVLDKVVELASAKSGGGTSVAHKDEAGVVVAIRCYYFKLWMRPDEVAFGLKASSSTGFNSMCKEGVSNWTKQQRTAKAAKEQLLVDVASGEIEPADLPNLLSAIDEEATQVVALVDGVGYDTLEQLLAA